MAFPGLRVRHGSLLTALACIAGGVLVLGQVGNWRSSQESSVRQARPYKGKPQALANHLQRLKQGLPGNGGEGATVPGSVADEEFALRAYPLTDIPLAQIHAARQAADQVNGRKFPSGKGRKGTWVSVGPSNALYPATQFRSSFSYVPNAY